MARHDDDDDFDDRPTARRRHDDDDDYDDRDESRRRRRYDDDEREHDFRKRDEPHSGLGVASLVLAIVAGIAVLALFAIAGVMMEEGGGDLDEESPAVIALGVLVLGALALTLLGLGLGIGALVQKDRNKLFGTLGVVANGLVLLGSSTLMCVGAMMN